MARDPSPTPSHSSKGGHGKGAAAAAAPLGAKTPPKMTLPDTFNGSRSRLKAHLAQVDLYIGFNLDKFKTEVDKVMWAISFLRGAAFDWIEVFLNDFMDNKEDSREPETDAIFGSYAEYKKRINRVFGDIDAKRSAERHLQGLRQHKSATTYTAEFQQHAGRTY
jgi:hypothetical protein